MFIVHAIISHTTAFFQVIVKGRHTCQKGRRRNSSEKCRVDKKISPILTGRHLVLKWIVKHKRPLHIGVVFILAIIDGMRTHGFAQPNEVNATESSANEVFPSGVPQKNGTQKCVPFLFALCAVVELLTCLSMIIRRGLLYLPAK